MTRASTAPVREGDLLAGKYRVERVLGAGGMGIVVAARHEQLDQLVAIKFVREEALENEDAVQRFLREARAAVKLKSEHVARVLDVGKLESGSPYMVMEFLEGNDVSKVLERDGPLPVEAAADWVLQACEAVAEAHAAGIVHRDLKPENLFLARTVGGAPKIKVLDFGVSKAIGGGSGDVFGLTRTRAMLGSPLYMAPEQMRSSRDVDARADVWALGVVLFQMLTRRWPFEAETMPELCLKVVTDPPLPLATLRPDVPPPLVAIVEQCLSKDPSLRFANAAELASALEPFAHPASRLLAERARMAIASSASLSGGHPAVPAARTLQSESSGSRLPIGSSTPGGSGSRTPVGSGSPTPGTSANWGAVHTSRPGDGRRSRASWVAVGIGVVTVAGAAAAFLALRGAPSAATPAPNPPETVQATTRPPPVAEPLPPLEPATDPTASPESSANPAKSQVAAPLSAHPLPSVMRTTVTAPPRHSGPSLPGRPSSTDEDIPTMR
jgi:serine/threonine-protein kinase